MSIRTYRARSMADAIDALQRDLGRDAVILHTRSYRVGGLFGIGGRAVVEVTATTAAAARQRAGRAASRSAQAPAPSRGRDAPPPARSADVTWGGEQRQPRRDTGQSQADAKGLGADIPKPTRAQAASEPDPLSADRRRQLLERYTQIAAARGTAPHASSPAPNGNQADKPAARTAAAQQQADLPQPPDAQPPERQTERPAQPQAGPPERLRATRSAGLPSSGARSADATLEHELRSLRGMLGRVLQAQGAAALGTVASGPLAEAYAAMTEAEVERELADRVVEAVRGSLAPDELADGPVVRGAVARHLADAIAVAPPSRGGRGADGPHTIALVGPTGVGKTTTAAKLAAAYKLRRGRRVGLITTDTFRIAAVEQLRTYASIISVPLRVVMSPAEMASARRALSDCDVVLIDTAGRSPRDSARVDELSGFLEAARPDETHLVLSATAGAAALRAAARGFMAAKADRLLLTKLDEAVGLGVVLSLAHELGLPLSFVTTGQEVPDHIEPANADRLARRVLAGELTPEASPRAANNRTNADAALTGSAT